MDDQNSSILFPPFPKLLLFAMVCGVISATGSIPKGNAQQTTDKKAYSAQEVNSKSETQEKEFPPILFSMNIDKPCLIYDTIGSLRLRPRTDKQRESPVPNPRLQIFPDGKVKTEKRGKTPSLESNISRERLMELMELAVNKASFYKLDSKDVAKQLKGLGGQSASAVLFRFSLEQGEHELVIQALGFEGRAAGATEDIKRMHELSNHCNQIYNEVNLGTKDEQTKILALLKTALSKEFPKIAPFTLKDLSLAARTPEGRLRSVFKRILTNEETKEPFQLLGSVWRESKSEDYVIKILTAPSKASRK